MRVIKFRVWHAPITEGEVTLPGHMDYELVHRKLIAVKTETREIPTEFGFEHIQHGLYFINADLSAYSDRLMQFTGLKDKNGKEIYEGDVLGFPTWPYDPSNGDSPITLAEVEWEAGRFRLGEYGLGEHAPEEVEIIGNIYENPNLLKP